MTNDLEGIEDSIALKPSIFNTLGQKVKFIAYSIQIILIDKPWPIKSGWTEKGAYAYNGPTIGVVGWVPENPSETAKGIAPTVDNWAFPGKRRKWKI